MSELLKGRFSGQLFDVRSSDDEAAPLTIDFAKPRISDDDPFKACSVCWIGHVRLLAACVARLTFGKEPAVVGPRLPPAQFYKARCDAAGLAKNPRSWRAPIF